LALQRGLSDADLRSRRYQRIFHGIYIASSVQVTTRVRAAAALRVSPPGSFASHHTAVRLWGGIPPETPLTHVSLPGPGVRCVRQGIMSHRGLPDAQLSRRFGFPISTAVQAFIELAAVGTHLVDLVVAGDSLVKAARIPPEAFVNAADEWTGRGAKLARRAARLVRVGVDSPQETRLRLLVVLAGLPEPEVNWIVRAEDGDWLRRYDMYYRLCKLILEYDGRQHAESDEQWGEDILRRQELDDQGIRILVVRHSGIYANPGQTVEKIFELLRERGAPGLPKRLNPEWSRHFPGQS
jgi:Protein of unknown function (DUF559)